MEVTLKGDKVKLKGSPLQAGDLAPNFLLVDEQMSNVTLERFKERRKLFWILPSIDTEVCLLSTKKLNDLCKKYPEVEFVVISADLPFAQKRACKEEDLNNLHMLSMMRNKEFGHAYGVLIAEGPLEGLLARSVYLIDSKDKVQYAEIVAEISSEPNYQALEESLT